MKRDDAGRARRCFGKVDGLKIKYGRRDRMEYWSEWQWDQNERRSWSITRREIIQAKGCVSWPKNASECIDDGGAACGWAKREMAGPLTAVENGALGDGRNSLLLSTISLLEVCILRPTCYYFATSTEISFAKDQTR